MIYMFHSNNPSSGDINSSNLPCLTNVSIRANIEDPVQPVHTGAV